MVDNPLFSYSSDELSAHAIANARNVGELKHVMEELARRAKKRGRLNKRAQATFLTVMRLAGELETTGSNVETTPENLNLYRWQKEALVAWRVANKKGIVEAVTGGGKTRVAIAAIQEQLNDDLDTVILVPSIILLHQWYDELCERFPNAQIGRLGDNHHDSLLNCNILVATAQSSSRHVLNAGSADALLVADEVHRFGAKTYRLALEEEFSRRLGLSATWERQDGAHEDVLKPYFGPVVFTLNFERARQDEIIAPFFLALIGVDLTIEEQDEYEAEGKKMGRQRRRLVRDFDAPDDDRFFRWLARAQRGEIPGAQRAAGIFHSAMTKRRAILAEAEAKIDTICELATLMGDGRRVIIFTETIRAADEIADAWKDEGVECSPYHSTLPQHKQDEILEQFRSGGLDHIVVAKKFDEGVDIPDADVALIVSTSRSNTQLVQRAGRVLRRKADGREAWIILLFARDTTEDPSQGALEEALDDLIAAANKSANIMFDDDPDRLMRFLTDTV
jgi:superfamily II DNA or RNA helicase